jgi:Fe2+ or Zn2+ uptake regulation protein
MWKSKWTRMEFTEKQKLILSYILRRNGELLKQKELCAGVLGSGVDITMAGVVYNINQFLILGYIERRETDTPFYYLYFVTEKGLDVLRSESTVDTDKNDLECIAEIPSETEGDAVAEKNCGYNNNCTCQDCNKTEGKRYVADESKKDEAIISTLNDTLRQTVEFCQSLYSNLNPRNKDVEDEIALLKKQNKDLMDINEVLDRERAETREYIERKLNVLICSLSEMYDEFFGLLPWAQQQNRGKFIADTKSEISETVEDLINYVNRNNVQ